MYGKFTYPAPCNKQILVMEMKKFDGEGNGEIICLECNEIIEGKNYSWKCRTCNKEYLGPILER